MATGDQDTAGWYCRGGPFDGQVKRKRLLHIGHRVGEWYYRETDEVISNGQRTCRIYEWVENTEAPRNARALRPPTD